MESDRIGNGTADGSVVMAKSEMDQTFPDDHQLVEDWNPNTADSLHEINQNGTQKQNLGMGFGKKGCSRPTGGLAILISGTIVFSVAVTVALIVQIYAGPHEVGQYGGVATDVPQCSEIGADILQQGGSAVDASIAALVCVSVINAHNSGVGGGGFMLIYDHKLNQTHAIDFRETAPRSANKDMFKDSPNDVPLRGPRSVGVPGFIRGMETAHRLYGRLPWSQLFLPSVEIARNGFNVTKEIVMSFDTASIKDFRGPLREVYVRNGSFVKVGDVISNPHLANTLQIIAEKGPASMYEGVIAESIVNATKGEITLGDLSGYTVVDREPVRTTFKDKTILSMPAPGGGPTLLMMLNILEGFGWTVKDRNDTAMYNRLLETFRFAYAQRPLLADPDFESSVDNSSKYMIWKSEAVKIREKILSYNGTKPVDFYLPPAFLKSSQGTSHVSAGDAKELYVSTTTSINVLFGASLMTSTGIQLNNHMADFDSPTQDISFGVPANSLNFPEPQKRPRSAMTPTILFTTKKPCAMRMSIGASNGTRIITGIAETLINMLLFDMPLADAIEWPRVHDGLFEKETDYEKGIEEHVISDLRDAGYKLHETTEGISCVQAVMVSNDTTYAHSDSRKGGQAAILKNEEIITE